MQLLALSQSGCNCIHFTDALDVNEVRVVLPDLHVGEAQGREIDSKQDLLAAVGSALLFPDYFGYNWDAALDCLRDFGWLDRPGYVLVLRNAAEVWRTCPKEVGTLVEVWLSAASFWSESQVPFHLVFVW